MAMFRALNENEVSVRVGQRTQGGDFTFLLYKNARTDADILDETVGPLDWKKEYTRDNANCIVSIWDEKKKQWVSKEDVGKESYAEGAKGIASDSFKRACVAWGIGRELYTAPFIFAKGNLFEVDNKGNIRGTVYVKKLEVSEDRKITTLVINYKNKGNDICVFSYGSKEKPAQATTQTNKTSAPANQPSGAKLTKKDCDPETVVFTAGYEKGKTVASAAGTPKGIQTIKYYANQKLGNSTDMDRMVLACQRYLDEHPEIA